MAKLPSFLVIGPPKCGTTSLHEYLRQHPNISLPTRKETHFFICDRDSNNLVDDYYGRVLKNAIFSLEEYLADFEPKAEPVTYGEVCPSYIHFENASVNIKRYIPDAKIMAILRNPVDRFYSSYHYRRLKRSGMSEFTEIVDSIRNNTMDIHTQRFLDIGLYYKHLMRYYEKFPRENIKILIFDDLSKRPRKLMNSIMEFIGLEEFPFNLEQIFNRTGNAKFGWLYKHLRGSTTANFLRKNLPTKLYQNTRQLGEKILLRPSDPIPEPERKYLQEFFREDLLKLQELIQLDLSDWLK